MRRQVEEAVTEAEAKDAEGAEASVGEGGRGRRERRGEGEGGVAAHLFEMAARHDMAILVVSVLPAPLSPLTRIDCAPPGKWVRW